MLKLAKLIHLGWISIRRLVGRHPISKQETTCLSSTVWNQNNSRMACFSRNRVESKHLTCRISLKHHVESKHLTGSMSLKHRVGSKHLTCRISLKHNVESKHLTGSMSLKHRVESKHLTCRISLKTPCGVKTPPSSWLQAPRGVKSSHG